MKKILFAACIISAISFTACDPQGTSHSEAGAEASPQNDRDTVGDRQLDTVPQLGDDSAGSLHPVDKGGTADEGHPIH